MLWRMYSADVDFGAGHIRVNADGYSREWFDVLSLRPKPPALCRGCGGAVTGVDGKVVVSHFRHLVEPERCVFENESADHRRLKHEIAAAVDGLDGWVSEQEVRASSGEWIADVMAVSTVGEKRVAFEVQLSPQDREWADERQRRRTADGVECLWVVGRTGSGPADSTCHLRSRSESIVFAGEYEGLADENAPTVNRCEVGLDDLVAAFLDDDLVFDRELDDPMRLAQYRSYRSDQERYKEQQKIEKEQQKRETEEAERHQQAEERERHKRVAARSKKRQRLRGSDHYQKQMAVVRAVIGGLLEEHGRGIEVGEFTGSRSGVVVRSVEDLEGKVLDVIDGSWEYAYGLPLGTMGEPFAVVCPKPWLIEASTHGPSLGGLTVYCHSSDFDHMEYVCEGTPIAVDVEVET